MATKPAPQRLAQLGELGAQPPLGQLGEHPGVALASDQGRQHRPTRGAQHISGDRVELDAGVLQRLLDVLALRASRSALHPTGGRRHYRALVLVVVALPAGQPNSLQIAQRSLPSS